MWGDRMRECWGTVWRPWLFSSFVVPEPWVPFQSANIEPGKTVAWEQERKDVHYSHGAVPRCLQVYHDREPEYQISVLITIMYAYLHQRSWPLCPYSALSHLVILVAQVLEFMIGWKRVVTSRWNRGSL